MYQYLEQTALEKRVKYLQQLTAAQRTPNDPIAVCTHFLQKLLATPNPNNEHLFYLHLSLILRTYYWIDDKGELVPPPQKYPWYGEIKDLFEERTAWMPSINEPANGTLEYLILRGLRRPGDSMLELDKRLISSTPNTVALFTPLCDPLLNTLLGEDGRELFCRICYELQETPVIDRTRTPFYEYFAPLAYQTLLYLIYWKIDGFPLEERLAKKLQEARIATVNENIDDDDVPPPFDSIEPEQAVFVGALALGNEALQALLEKELLKEEIAPALLHYITPIILRTSIDPLLDLYWNAVIRSEDWTLLLCKLNSGSFRALQAGIYSVVQNDLLGTEFVENFLAYHLLFYIEDKEAIKMVGKHLVEAIIDPESHITHLLAAPSSALFYIGAWLAATMDYKGFWQSKIVPKDLGGETEERYVAFARFVRTCTADERFRFSVAWRALVCFPDSELIYSLYVPCLGETLNNLDEQNEWFEHVFQANIFTGRILEELIVRKIRVCEEQSRSIFDALENLFKRLRELAPNDGNDRDAEEKQEELLPPIFYKPLNMEIPRLSQSSVLWLMTRIAVQYPDLISRLEAL
ncbi:MAG: hypothetical protein ACTTKF_06355 [Bacteroides sp.]